MQIKPREYPHPVLSYFSDDYVGCAFQSSLKILTTRTTYIFEVICKTSAKELVELLKKDKAHYAFHIECPSTRFRSVQKTSQDNFSFEIPSDMLEGKVYICALILASEDIPKYRSRNFHPDYSNFFFKIKRGDVLAVDRDRIFFADKEIDPLKRIPSIFTICQNNNSDAAPCDLLLGDHKIVIMLSPVNFKRYKTLKSNQNLHPILSSLLIMPVLVSILEMLEKDEGQEYEEKRWYRVLAKKLKTIGIDINNINRESSMVLAQKLIGDPLSNAFEALEEYDFED